MEIERKFLIEGFPEGLVLLFRGHVEQSYLCTSPEVRVRRVTPSAETPGEVSCKLCIKSEGGLVREEIETPITPGQFDAISAMTGRRPITKDFRVYELDGDLRLEVSLVDEGEPTGFMYAEVEFPSVDAANAFEPPAFLGRELTNDPGARMKSYWENGKITF